MDKIPRMSRVERRQLVRLGRRSGDPATAVRFHVIARLGRGERSPEVAEGLEIARSTVVRTAASYRNRWGRRPVGSAMAQRDAESRRPFPYPCCGASSVARRRTSDGCGPRGRANCCVCRCVVRAGRALRSAPWVAPSRTLAHGWGFQKPHRSLSWPPDAREAVLRQIRARGACERSEEPVLYSERRSTSTSTRRSGVTGC